MPVQVHSNEKEGKSRLKLIEANKLTSTLGMSINLMEVAMKEFHAEDDERLKGELKAYEDILNGVREMETLDGPGIITNATAARLKEFNTARNWDEIHTAPNLAKSICIEAAELLELFQWDDKSLDIERVKEELADVIIYSLNMVEALNLDADAIVNEKITKNSKKYPTG